MTIAGYAVSWWQQFILVCLVLLGAGMVARWLWQGSWWAVWNLGTWWRWLRRDRVAPLLEDCDHEYTPNEAGTMEWCQKCDSVRPTLLELPPERTWEQMTSHQLPLEPSEKKSRFLFAAERERRPPAWETDHRAHYVAMGFEYPSGLMARVREAAQ